VPFHVLAVARRFVRIRALLDRLGRALRNIHPHRLEIEATYGGQLMPSFGGTKAAFQSAAEVAADYRIRIS